MINNLMSNFIEGSILKTLDSAGENFIDFLKNKTRLSAARLETGALLTIVLMNKTRAKLEQIIILITMHFALLKAHNHRARSSTTLLPCLLILRRSTHYHCRSC